MNSKTLSVGSIPPETSEAVFRALGPAIGAWPAYLPDAEAGERRFRIDAVA